MKATRDFSLLSFQLPVNVCLLLSFYWGEVDLQCSVSCRCQQNESVIHMRMSTLV